MPLERFPVYVVVLTLIATLFVGGLALLAQWARASRGAEITLLTVLLVLSLLIGGVGAITGFGLVLTAAGGTASTGDRVAFVAAGVAAILVGIAGVALCVPPLRQIMGGRLKNAFWADPPVFFALWLLVVVLANNTVSFLIFTQEPDVSQLYPSGRVSPITLVTSELPFVALALAGVGIGVRRGVRETLDRLGFGPISLKHLGIVVVFVAGAFGLSAAADALFSAVQPDLYKTVGELSDSLFNPKGLAPVAAVSFALMIGIGAALGEESLFRGAVQPVLGIPITSILFTSIHIQYGPSILLGYVFLLAIGLGLLRKHINTTASFIAHVGYNTLSIVIPYFLGS